MSNKPRSSDPGVSSRRVLIPIPGRPTLHPAACCIMHEASYFKRSFGETVERWRTGTLRQRRMIRTLDRDGTLAWLRKRYPHQFAEPSE